jgi:hypothetical protein
MSDSLKRSRCGCANATLAAGNLGTSGPWARARCRSRGRREPRGEVVRIAYGLMIVCGDNELAGEHQLAHVRERRLDVVVLHAAD